MSDFDCVTSNESDAIASAIQNGSSENSAVEAVTAIIDTRGSDDKQSKERMEEIDFEKELMAIRASEDDDEIEGVVSNSRSTPNNHTKSRNSDSISGGGNTESGRDTNSFSFLNSNDTSASANVVMGRSDSIDDDELRQLLQESDTEGEQQLLGRQKSSSSSTPHSKKDPFNDSSIPDVTMPPDGIIENDDGTYSCYVIVPAGNIKHQSPLFLLSPPPTVLFNMLCV